MIDRNQIKTIFFDLDGTLVDNFEAIYNSYCYMVKALGKEPVDYPTLRKTVGGSIVVTFQKLLGQDDVEEAVKIYRNHYADHLLEGLELLPGVAELLEHLQGLGKEMAVFTNKEGNFARTLCEAAGITQYFKHIVGVIDVPYRKPEKAYSEHMLSIMDASPETSLMVGDSRYDVLSGSVVNMPTYLVATGSHSYDELVACDPQPACVFKDFYAMGEAAFGYSPLSPTS